MMSGGDLVSSLVAIQFESSANLGTKTITANGTYTAQTDGYDGYSSVTVAVPTGADICVEIESLTTCGGGQLCTGYHYYLKQGRLAQSGKFSSWAVATHEGKEPRLYEYEEARPLGFYVCIYDDDDNLMMIHQPTLGNGQYLTEYYARRLAGYYDDEYFIYATSEYITLGVGQTSYSVSVNNTNVSLSITMSEGLQFTQYAYDGSIIDRSVSTETRYIYCNIPDGSYGGGNKVYTPLSASDFSAFLADFVQAAYNDHNQ